MRVILAIVLFVTLICGGFFFLETLRELPHPILIKDNPEDLKKDMEALFAEASKIETQFNDLESGRTKNLLTPDMVKSVKVRMDLLYRNDPNNTKAKTIGDKLDGILVEVDRKNEVNRPIEARNKYAQNLEVTMLRAGRDMTIRATEKSSTTLEIKYVLMNRPAVFQLVEDGRLFENAKSLGFKTVVLTDGYGKVWKYNTTGGRPLWGGE